MGGGLRDSDEGGNFFTHVNNGLVKVDVLDDEFVGLRTRGRGGRDKPAVREVARPPKIDSSNVSMVFNKHIGDGVEFREVKVVEAKVPEIGRPHSQEGRVKGPDVFEGRLDTEEVVGADERRVGVSAPIEGENLPNGLLNLFPKVRGEDKKKGNVREKRDYEDIDE